MKKLNQLMWNEWTHCVLAGAAEANAECAGILESLYMSSSESRIKLGSQRLWVFRRFSRIWPQTKWGQENDIGTMLKVPPSMHGKVLLDIEGDLYGDIKLSMASSRHSKHVWHWLRGIWGNNGSIYLPKRGYYLVFRMRTNESANRVKTALQNIHLKPGSREKGGYFEILLRDQDDIVTLFSKFKLYETSLFIEQRSMVRAMRERANKLVNCDASNIRKSLEAAQKQIRLASYLQQSGLYRDLPSSYREVIDARLKHPSATLNELGQFLDHPVSKSTVKYRWKKLHDMAGEKV